MPNAEEATGEALRHGPSLDGGWSFQAQFEALKKSSGPPQDDFTFREQSVKDVSDRGRAEGAAKMQQVLEDVLSSQRVSPVKQEACKAFRKCEGPEAAEVCREVQSLVRVLQGLRKSGGAAASRSSAALDALRQLDSVNVSVACLKVTKVAVEVNQPCWRGNEASGEIRNLATALVKEWRGMYRAETGQGSTSTLNPVILSRRCKTLSMDLEDCAYGKHQRAKHYIEVVNCICGLLRLDETVGKRLLDGHLRPKELVGRAGDHIGRREERLYPKLKRIKV